MNLIKLENIAKRYGREWIFRDVNLELMAGGSYVILGSNGSGKSTLLQIISSYLTPSKGQIRYLSNGQVLPVEKIYRHISIATPYMELPEEFTLTEVLEFHSKLKRFYKDFSIEEVMEIMELEKAKNKALGNFSSGMKQRVKLALAILTQSDLLLLDEPSSNLDARSVRWFQSLIREYKENRILVVCSNHIEEEYSFCEHEILMEDYK